MFVRASSTSVLVVSLLANDFLGAVCGRAPLHCKRTELTVTDSIYATADWSDGEKLGVECPTEWLPTSASTSSKDGAVSQYATTSITDTYVPPVSSTVPLSDNSATVNGAEFVQQPKITSIILAATLSTPAAVPTTMATAPTTDAFKKRGLAINDTVLTQFFIGSNSKVSWAYNWGQKPPGLASGLDQANMDVNIAVQAYMSYIEPFAGKAKLGAPAVTNGGGSMGLTYLSNFISNCSSCTMDFLNIHWYDSATNFAYFKSHVEQAYTAGGTDDEQNTSLEIVIPWLDAQPYVERYAYFMCSKGVLVSGNGPSTLGTTFMSFSQTSPL